MDADSTLSELTPEIAPDTVPAVRAPLLRTPSMWSYEILQEMGLKMIDDPAAFEALPKKEQNREIVAFMWAHLISLSEDEIEERVHEGGWWESVRAFQRDPISLAALPEVEPRMAEMMRMMRDEPGA